ncbi:MAG: hypothetical protein K2X35_14315 [Bryobacteraceae bacterium]|nr:hypothetical protein [Bryobacteraceae bacterium]
MKVPPADAATFDPAIRMSRPEKEVAQIEFQRELERLIEGFLDRAGVRGADVRVEFNVGRNLTERQIPVRTAAPPPPTQPRRELAASHAWMETTQTNSSADRYWARQPVEVQALRDAPAAERESMARDLAQRGFAIDTAIMVWGWDPERTMRLRMEYGYTWVPSALQPAVQVAPGLTFPGLPSYQADVIPPGAIRVSLDFLENT